VEGGHTDRGAAPAWGPVGAPGVAGGCHRQGLVRTRRSSHGCLSSLNIDPGNSKPVCGFNYHQWHLVSRRLDRFNVHTRDMT